jgi:hypothetical protein
LLLGKCNYFMEKLDLSSAGFDTLSSTDILGIKCSNNISTVFIFVIYMHPKSSASEYELLFQLLAQFVDIQGHRILTSPITHLTYQSIALEMTKNCQFYTTI